MRLIEFVPSLPLVGGAVGWLLRCEPPLIPILCGNNNDGRVRSYCAREGNRSNMA